MSPRLSASVRRSASRESYDTQRKAAPSIAYEAPRWLRGGSPNHLRVLSKADGKFYLSARTLGNTRLRLHRPRLVGVVLARLQPVSVVSRPRRMFAEPLRGQRNELTAPRGLARRHAAFSWLRR